MMKTMPAMIAAPDDAQDQGHARMLRRLGIRGVGVLTLFTLAIGLWAVTIPFAGSVIAPATLATAVQPVPISHLTGGPIASLHVREGQNVKAGDLLVKFEATTAETGLAIMARQVDETKVHLARLTAEHSGTERIVFDRDLVERARQVPELERLMGSETRLFETRAATRKSSVAQVEQRIVQLSNQIRALNSQRAARQKELAVNGPELEGVRKLYERGLVPISRFAALERSGANLQGQIGQISAQISQISSRIAEARLEILQIDETARKDALADLREAETRIFDITARRTIAQDQLQNLTLVASTDGVVHRLAAQGPGAVLAPGEVVLQIVPHTMPLRANLRIQPRDIDLIHLGQQVRLNLNRATGQARSTVSGRITRIATDVSREGNSGPHSYLAQVELDDLETRATGGEPLRAGLIGEAFVNHERRTLAGYIFAPILQQFGAMR
jgi:HlyD family secretion protein